LFRGQNADKPLLPRIARLAEKKGIPFADVTDIERKMLQRFRRESVPMLGTAGTITNWELLSIAQHQGMPTRLLDWTANALAGLWFAVSTDPPDKERHGVVWVLEVDPANEKTPKAGDDIFDLHRTYVFQPFHLDRRIVAQSAWFSVTGTPKSRTSSYRSNKTTDTRMLCRVSSFHVIDSMRSGRSCVCWALAKPQCSLTYRDWARTFRRNSLTLGGPSLRFEERA
jgi:hypothetical protein